MLIEGVKGSQQWRTEQEHRTLNTESVQIFHPRSPEQDTQIVIRVASCAAWDVLCGLGIVQSA